MGRGKDYTPEENEKLMNLYNDMHERDEKVKYIDVARKAQRYGICEVRPVRALADHIRQILEPEEDSGKKTEHEKLEVLLDACIGKADVYPNVETGRPLLKLNFSAITAALIKEFKERYYARIKEYLEGGNE